MGTSNWQNISLCCDLIRRIAPTSVLDIGCGFGRWGVLCREMLDVWGGHLNKETWTTRIDGVEAFAPNITPLHQHIYSSVIVEDALVVLPKLPSYDLIIAGDVLEHFERKDAESLLAQIIAKSGKAALLCVPLGDFWPQSNSYENEFERHRSVWFQRDFVRRGGRVEVFWDYIDRPFGVVLFPKGSRAQAARPIRRQIKSFIKRALFRIRGF